VGRLSHGLVVGPVCEMGCDSKLIPRSECRWNQGYDHYVSNPPGFESRAGFPIDGRPRKRHFPESESPWSASDTTLPIGVIEAERPLRIFVFVRKESQ
jgi:hypothetical protein